ncbi:putative myosin light chain kinase [Gracilariopsis chorda]|uniref:Putative myosin light chain kinase n=1 Tax=Gracilariopsis chorda TaxID=448386 RepID=A0A2V3IV66_9FLOR|nr:putative myosin light chain kinase [Gracilariopsis chorda]|eukprot:PXF45983.1 putative myosin light chain kinase [Gracilariopsis chorda]
MSHLRHGRPHRIRGWALVRWRSARLAQRRYMRLVHYSLSVYDGPAEAHDLLVLQCCLLPSQVSAVPRRREIVVKMPADKLVVSLRTEREFDAWFTALCDAARVFDAFYTLVPGKQLGCGAFSTVFFAFDKGDGHHVAVKIVDKSLCSRVELTHAHTEARVMAFVTHPCIVQCLDVFDSPEAVHLVMNYMSASTLDSRMYATIPAKRPLLESVAATIMSRLLHALAYLHAENICHRDVKPDNILLTAHPNDNLWATTARLSDFGLAAFVDEEAHLTDIVGTPNYLAPEIISRHPDDNQRLGYGPPVDVWAAGVTMFWLLSGGTLPFDAADPATVLKNIRASRLKLSSDPWNRVSDHAKSLLRAFLHPNPSTRLTAAAACAHPWLRHSQQVLPVTSRTLSYRRVGRLTPADRWRVAILAVRAFLNLTACVDQHRVEQMYTIRRTQLQRAAEKRRETARRSDTNEKAPERAPAGADALGYNVGLIPSFAPKRRARAPPPDRAAKLRNSKSLSLEKRVFARISVERDSVGSDRSSTGAVSNVGAARSVDGDSLKSEDSEGGSSSSTRSSLRTFRLGSRGVKKISRFGASRAEGEQSRMSNDASRSTSHVL